MEEKLRKKLLSFPEGTVISRSLLNEFLSRYSIEDEDTCVLEFESNHISVAGKSLASNDKPFLIKVFKQT